jgi:hypothetical protein
MSADHLPYSELSETLARLERLQFLLDFSVWLTDTYHGKPADTVVSLIREPRRAFESRLTAYLADELNQSELRLHWLHCPLCNTQYLQRSAGETCPARKPSEGGGPPQACGEPLVEVVEVVSENMLRERASSALYQTPEGIRRTVSSWVAQRFGEPEIGEAEFGLSVAELQLVLTEMMEAELDALTSSLPERDPLHLEGRRRLFPQGGTREEKYEDYRRIRDSLISCHNWLLQFARNHPVAAELGERLHLSSRFPPPVPLLRIEAEGAGTTPETSRGQSEGNSEAALPVDRLPSETTPAKPTDAALIALLRVFTHGLADDRIRKASPLVTDDALTANEKLTKIDALIPFPPTASAEQLGELLGVTKQAIMKTAWWKEHRKGEKESEIGRRRAGHEQRAKEYEEPTPQDDA